MAQSKQRDEAVRLAPATAAGYRHEACRVAPSGLRILVGFHGTPVPALGPAAIPAGFFAACVLPRASRLRA